MTNATASTIANGRVTAGAINRRIGPSRPSALELRVFDASAADCIATEFTAGSFS